MKTAVNSDVAAALAGLEKRAIRHIFLVACGGSLSVMMPGKYFLDRYAGHHHIRCVQCRRVRLPRPSETRAGGTGDPLLADRRHQGNGARR